MTVIRIQERGQELEGFQAVVSFDHGPEYAITVTDPFSAADEKRLEWYYEEYLEFPFTKGVKVREAAASITTYGEALFQQVFAENPKVLVPYKTAVQAGLSTVHVEIAGSAGFHALHWEALKDPDLPHPLALHATMVRKNLYDQPIHAEVRPAPTINLLVVAARPYGKRDMGYRTISHPLIDLLRQSRLPMQVQIVRPGTYEALAKHLQRVTDKQSAGYYHVIHFDLHGSLLTYEHLHDEQEGQRFLCTNRYGRKDIEPFVGHKAFLAFEGPRDGEPDPVEAQELADLLLYHKIPIALLNACQSGKQIGATETSLGSQLMQAGAQLVLAMGYSVTVSAAELLMKTLYQQLAAGEDLAVAIRHARTELYNHKTRRAYFGQQIDLEDWLMPVVYQNQPVWLEVHAFSQGEHQTYQERQAELNRYQVLEPQYGFVGRDLDILQIERRLLAHHNLLLVRGMGGAGKTTLLRHLQAWWRTTEFVTRVFYFGYDERAWTRQQIMTTLARALYEKVQYVRDFQPLAPEAQQAMLAGTLRAERHLLILDNLESITGSHLAIKHTLSKKEQDALHRFLSALSGGQTLVLLGSRSSEEWLAKQTFEENVYDLPGLDPEAASILAERILEKHHAARYRRDKELQHLLKLLDGFPLALEVVLANLAHQTPAEILTALQAGEVTMQVGDSEKRTENILRCIDYSHSNLSREAQHLLLCLAPFTSVIWQDTFEEYTTHLRQQPALAALPVERMQEVIQQATHWGLLSPDLEIPGFLRLQPTLPYFLRTHLHEAEQAEVRQAIEAAFRLHYDRLGGMLSQLLESKDPQQRQAGHLLVGLEYENLVTALQLALAAQVSILKPYLALSAYLDTTQDQQRGLELGHVVLSRMEAYPPERLTGQVGFEFVGVIDNIAKRQLLLKQYQQAEQSYQRALSIWLENTSYSASEIRKMSASIYHQLGYVAQQQRQWQQAEQYYQQALQIYVEYNARYEQADTYHNLGVVAEEQRQWQQARDYFLTALKTYVEYDDTYSGGTVLRSLARLWQARSDQDVPVAIASILGATVEEAEVWLRERSGDGAGEAGNA